MHQAFPTLPMRPDNSDPALEDEEGELVAPTSVQHRLQDVLPEIMHLAQRVGGLDQLAEIVETLRQMK